MRLGIQPVNLSAQAYVNAEAAGHNSIFNVATEVSNCIPYPQRPK